MTTGTVFTNKQSTGTGEFLSRSLNASCMYIDQINISSVGIQKGINYVERYEPTHSWL